MPEDPSTPSFAEALASMAEALSPIPEAVAGYRAQCQAQGFSETASEVMAMDYHALLLAQFRKALGT